MAEFCEIVDTPEVACACHLATLASFRVELSVNEAKSNGTVVGTMTGTNQI